MIGPTALAKANLFGALASVTFTIVFHFLPPLALLPLNFTPTSGPLPPTHWPPVASGLHSPMRVRSLTNAYTVSGGAAMCVVADTVALSVMAQRMSRARLRRAADR